MKFLFKASWNASLISPLIPAGMLVFSAGVFAMTPTEVAKSETDRFPPETTLSSGWTMRSLSGHVFHRSDLNQQAERLAAQGLVGFPAAFSLLDHREMYMRYIGVKALEKITDLRPVWYYFGSPDGTFNGDRDWAERAKKQWMKWYEKTRAK